MDPVDKFRRTSYKLTKPRLVILEYLAKQKKPRSVREIHQQLNRERIDLVSAYRNLELFKELGIIFEEKMNNQSYFYIADKIHHHIICSKCRLIECFPCHNEIIRLKNFSSMNHQLSMTGICNKCSSRKEKR